MQCFSVAFSVRAYEKCSCLRWKTSVCVVIEGKKGKMRFCVKKIVVFVYSQGDPMGSRGFPSTEMKTPPAKDKLKKKMKACLLECLF